MIEQNRSNEFTLYVNIKEYNVNVVCDMKHCGGHPNATLFSLLFIVGTSQVSATELDVDCESPLNQSEILYCTTRDYEKAEEMIQFIQNISSKSDKQNNI